MSGVQDPGSCSNISEMAPRLLLAVVVIPATLADGRDNQTGAAHDLFSCDRQCRWFFGAFDRRIQGERLLGERGQWLCACTNGSTAIGTTPYFTNFSVMGPPTVPNGLFERQCCKDGDDVPWADCTQPTGHCHANVYPHAKPFDADYWAGTYTTQWLCVRALPDAAPSSILMPDEMHGACLKDGDKAADAECRAGKARLEASGLQVLHCGRCSACSHPSDIELLYRTRESITTEITACSARWVALQHLPFAQPTLLDLKRCLVGRGVAFSDDGRAWPAPRQGRPSCMDVWTDNILNDASLCTRFCLTKFLRTANQGNFAKDPCLQCDEYTSGPAFIMGAGANRRSAGIVSDIRRDQLRGTAWAQLICKVGLYSKF